MVGFACVRVILNEVSDQFGESFGEPTGIRYICDTLQRTFTFLLSPHPFFRWEMRSFS